MQQTEKVRAGPVLAPGSGASFGQGLDALAALLDSFQDFVGLSHMDFFEIGLRVESDDAATLILSANGVTVDAGLVEIRLVSAAVAMRQALMMHLAGPKPRFSVPKWQRQNAEMVH